METSVVSSVIMHLGWTVELGAALHIISGNNGWSKHIRNTWCQRPHKLNTDDTWFKSTSVYNSFDHDWKSMDITPRRLSEGMAKIWKDLQLNHELSQSSHHPAHWRSPCFLQRTFGTLPQQTSANMDCAVNWQNGQTNPWTIFKTHTQTNDNKWISIKTRWLQLVAIINSLS